MNSKESMERRRFIQLLALTGALAAAESKAWASPTERTRASSGSKKHEPPRSAALQKELDSQKKALHDQLRVVRAHRLPAGSPPAFVFQPIRPVRPRERA